MERVKREICSKVRELLAEVTEPKLFVFLYRFPSHLVYSEAGEDFCEKDLEDYFRMFSTSRKNAAVGAVVVKPSRSIAFVHGDRDVLFAVVKKLTTALQHVFRTTKIEVRSV